MINVMAYGRPPAQPQATLSNSNL